MFGSEEHHFTLHYNPLLFNEGTQVLGEAWTHNHAIRLEDKKDGRITLWWNGIRFNEFVVGEDGVYRTQVADNWQDRIVSTLDGYLLTLPDQSTYQFSLQG